MKRRLFKLALFLLLGASVNVAVAWGFTAKLEFDSLLFAENKEIIDESEWPGGVPRHWPSLVQASELHMFGWLVRHFASGRHHLNQTATQGKNPEYFFVNIYEVGWPCRSLQWEYWWEFEITPLTFTDRTEGHPVPTWWRSGIHVSVERFGFGTGSMKGLPIHPVYFGFAINTLFYGAMLWLVIPGSSALRRFIRRQRGRCIKCGYDLRETSEGCPECGWQREAEG